MAENRDKKGRRRVETNGHCPEQQEAIEVHTVARVTKNSTGHQDREKLHKWIPFPVGK